MMGRELRERTILGRFKVEIWAESEGYAVEIREYDRLARSVFFQTFAGAQDGAEEIAEWLREQLRIRSP